MPAEKKAAPRARKSSRPERFDALASQLGGAGEGSRLAESDLSQSIGFLIRLASGVAQGHLGEQFDQLGLRQSLYSVLLIIHENPGLKQQEVGEMLSIQQPNLVALINELLGAGMITRTVNADDRRSYSLFLTPEGRARLTEANTIHARHEARLAKAVAPLKPAEFRAALVRISQMKSAD
jgi:DNA-binding MarR family transcriptional regulator